MINSHSGLFAITATLCCLLITPGITQDLDQLSAFDYITQRYGGTGGQSRNRRVLMVDEDSMPETEDAETQTDDEINKKDEEVQTDGSGMKSDLDQETEEMEDAAGDKDETEQPEQDQNEEDVTPGEPSAPMEEESADEEGAGKERDWEDTSTFFDEDGDEEETQSEGKQAETGPAEAKGAEEERDWEDTSTFFDDEQPESKEAQTEKDEEPSESSGERDEPEQEQPNEVDEGAQEQPAMEETEEEEQPHSKSPETQSENEPAEKQGAEEEDRDEEDTPGFIDDEDQPKSMEQEDDSDQQGGTTVDDDQTEIKDNDQGESFKMHSDSVSEIYTEEEEITKLLKPLDSEIQRIIKRLTEQEEPVHSIENAKYDMKKLENLRLLRKLFVSFYRLSNEMRHDHYRYMQQLHEKWEEQRKIQMRAKAEVNSVGHSRSEAEKHFQSRRNEEKTTFEILMKVWHGFVKGVSKWVNNDPVYSETITTTETHHSSKQETRVH